MVVAINNSSLFLDNKYIVSKNFAKKIWFLKNKFVYLQCKKEMLSRCEGPKLLGNPTEYNSFRPRFSGSNPEGGTFFTKKVKIFKKSFTFLK